MRETPGLKEGHALEIALVGSSPSLKFDPKRKHGDRTEQELVDSLDTPTCIQIVKAQQDDIEKRASMANESNPIFAHTEYSTHPTKKYLAALYHEVCILLKFDEIDSKNLRIYNSVDTMLDKMGVDFFIEFDPSLLRKEQFGDIGRITEKLYVSADVTLDLRKAGGTKKTDVVLPYENIPEEEDLEAAGKADAKKIIRALVDKIRKLTGSIYEPPILKQLEHVRQIAPASRIDTEIEEIRHGVHIRRKKVA